MSTANTADLVVISPCRNEAQYLVETIGTMLAQTLLPARWIIVDDGSTDGTAELLAACSARHDFIEVVTRADRGHRAVGPGVIDAFYTGFDLVRSDGYRYVCKLDLDLRLPPRYFEILIGRMEADPDIATCSGKAYVERDGELAAENHGDETSLGMTKLYRTSAFEAIGGFVREVMWDGIDCHRCRMAGLIAVSWDEPELRFVHLRPMGSSQQNVYKGRMRHGYGQYVMGTGLFYMTVSALSRWREPPVVLGSLAMWWGWVHSALTRKARYGDCEFRHFLRRYQRLALLHGKKQAAEIVRLERLGEL